MSDDLKDMKGKDARPTLDDDQIQNKRGMSRRNMLRGFGVGTLGLGALGVSGCVVVPTPGGGGTGFTDSDNGPITDPGGFGRGGLRGYYTGYTDSDNGPIVDPAGQGRG